MAQLLHFTPSITPFDLATALASSLPPRGVRHILVEAHFVSTQRLSREEEQICDGDEPAEQRVGTILLKNR